MKKLLLIPGIVILGACTDKTLEDLPNDNQEILQEDMVVWQAPDQFPNVAFHCNGATGMYLTTREHDSLTVVPNDPACGGQG